MDKPIEKKNKIGKKTIWISVFVIIGVLIFYNIFFGDKSSKLNVDKEKMTIEEVKEDLFKNYIAVSGMVEPIKTVYLDATEGGSRVEEIIIDEGNMVEIGEIIVKLSNTSLILEISNYEALVSRTSNELRQARLLMEQQTLNSKSQLLELQTNILRRKRAFERNKILFRDKHISEEEFKISEEQFDLTKKRRELLLENLQKDSVFRNIQVGALEKSVDRMESNLKLVQKRLESLNYRAPVSGELASLDLEVGQVISRGERI